MSERVLVLACGALAREIRALALANGWSALEVETLPAALHDRPAEIAPRVAARLAEVRGRYARVLVAYAECGTRGELDRVLRAEGVERLPGAHCYEVYAGSERFAALAAEAPGTFYLTDFLAKSFDELVWRGLGLDRHPELLEEYFARYTRVVWLAQTDDPAVRERARSAAGRLGLELVEERVGYGELQVELGKVLGERR